MLYLEENQKVSLQSIINELTPNNNPKPGQKGMLRLSDDNQNLVICVCIDTEKKEKFKRFVSQKGHSPKEQLIQKIPAKTLFVEGKEIQYIYFHKVELFEEVLPQEVYQGILV